MARKIEFGVGEYYHLYNRGTDKRIIFTDQDDYRRFLALLYLANNSDPIEIPRKIWLNPGGSTSVFEIERSGERIVDIGAYVLMPNHFHLLVKEIQEGGISTFMKKILTGYPMYFNLKHQRTGTLFEGTFKAKHADSDEYLRYLFAYMHLNPLKIINPNWKDGRPIDIDSSHDYLKKYEYSSYGDYLESGKGKEKILNNPSFPNYFSNSAEHKEELTSWLQFTEDTEDQPP